MKKITFLFILIVTNLSFSQTDIWVSDSEDYASWSFEDVDGDTNNWTIDISGGNGGYGYTGTVFFSDAFNKTPNNLLKSPVFSIDASLTTLNFEMRVGNAIGGSFTLENYMVYIYDTAVNPTADYTIATEIMNTTANLTSNSEIVSAVIPSSFAGKTVGIIIRHYNTSGVLGNLIIIDDFKVSSPMSLSNVTINPKVYLHGAAINPNVGEESLMRDDLRVDGLIPTTSPYIDALTCNATVFNTTGPDAIVDWVWVELRDKNDNTSVLHGTSALLQRDGDIVDTDGASDLNINIVPDDYYVAIKHRNHLAIMSSNVISLSATAATVDFTNLANQITYGTNAQTTSGMQSGIIAMWSGNANGDTSLRYQGSGNDTNNIKDNVLADSGNTTNSNLHLFTGYDMADTDLNGEIRYQGSGNDTNNIKDAVLAHPDNQSSPSNLFIVLEQLPEN